jgi:hypothetical protein
MTALVIALYVVAQFGAFVAVSKIENVLGPKADAFDEKMQSLFS